MGLSWFLPRIIGLSTAAELMYTGRFVEAEEGLRVGLFSTVTAVGGDVEAAHGLARKMLENTPFGLRMTKELLNQTLGAASLDAMVELENRSQVLCSLTEDFNQAAKALMQRADRATPQTEESDKDE